MKTIKLKGYKEFIKGQTVVITTVDLLKTAINNTPPQGFTIEEVRNGLRVIAALDKASKDLKIPEGEINDEDLNKISGTVKLEDSDYDLLKKCFKAMKWGFIGNSILEVDAQLK